MQILGYMVVRLPEFTEVVGPGHLLKIPSAYGKTYRGVDRLPWEVTIEQCAAPEFRDFFKKLDHSVLGLLDSWLTQDREDVSKFLEMIPREWNEVLAVCTESFPEVPRLNSDDDVEKLGCELFAWGEWSPHAAMFFDVERSKDWILRFNENGLFDDFSPCESFAQAYVEGSKLGWLEPYGMEPPDFIKLEVYRVRNTF